MNLQNDCTKMDQLLQEHLNIWDHKILPHFPKNLDETGTRLGALQRKRGSCHGRCWIRDCTELYLCTGETCRCDPADYTKDILPV